MPREQINFPDLYVHADNPDQAKPPGAGESWRDSAVHVSWQFSQEGGGHVQIAFESDPSYLRMALASPNEQEDRTSMYTPVLTRGEINRMIKTLRRARDAAYGRDE